MIDLSKASTTQHAGEVDDEDEGDKTEDNQSEEEPHPKKYKLDKDSSGEEEDAEDPENPHCDINFVKNTPYNIFGAKNKVVWAKTILRDPAPRIPTCHRSRIHAKDYVLVKGQDLQLKNNRSTTAVTFHPEEEMILMNDFTEFEQDMTAQDLFDLGDTTFLLWWQCVEAPKIPKTAKPRKR